MKLDTSSEGIVRQVVGRMHVSESDQAVRDYVRSRLNNKAGPAFVAAVEAYAVEVHAENRQQFADIMSGRGPDYGQEK